MAAPFHELVRSALPNLTPNNYRITSPASWGYNCIAWALGICDSWWWPIPGRTWPLDVPRDETLESFVAAFAIQGFSACESFELESGLEKVALYTIENKPTHAARQISNGWWTSKLGPSFDIEHASLAALAGGIYGEPTIVLCRSTLK